MRKAKPIQVWKCSCVCGQWMVEYEAVSRAGVYLETLIYSSFSMAIFRAGQEEAHLKGVLA